MKLEIVSDKKIKVAINSPDEMLSLGRRLGAIMRGGETVYLNGELGAGKTLLTQGIALTLGIKRIKSPSFIIVAEHFDGKLPLIHVDLYRLVSQEEIEELDLTYYTEQNAVLVIEWAEKWDMRPMKNTIDVTIEKDYEYNNKRLITFQSDRISVLNEFVEYIEKI